MHVSLLFIQCCVSFFFLNKFIYLFLAALGLRCCTQAFSSCGERGLLFLAVRGLLIMVASLLAEHGLQVRRLSSCGTRAQLFCGMWDLPRPRLELVSPALAGGLPTTTPPGKSQCCVSCFQVQREISIHLSNRQKQRLNITSLLFRS